MHRHSDEVLRLSRVDIVHFHWGIHGEKGTCGSRQKEELKSGSRARCARHQRILKKNLYYACGSNLCCAIGLNRISDTDPANCGHAQ